MSNEHPDRELLELAAKAAGVPAYWSDDGTIQQRPMLVVKAGGGMGTMPYEAEWNPLKDDATALRLAVKLNITICRPVEGDNPVHWRTSAMLPSQRLEDDCWERDNGDPYAATRRAIVRAAAEIGRTQEAAHG